MKTFASAESWLTPEKSVIVSTKPCCGEHPRRRGRVERVADQRQAHRDHEHVADEVVGLVAEEVEPDQEAERDRELGVEVELVGEVDQPVGGQEERLQAGLEEGVGRALEVDHLLAVGDRVGALAVGDAADQLVGDVDAGRGCPSWRPASPQPWGSLDPMRARGTRHGDNCNRPLTDARASDSGEEIETRGRRLAGRRSRASGRRRRRARASALGRASA